MQTIRVGPRPGEFWKRERALTTTGTKRRAGEIESAAVDRAEPTWIRSGDSTPLLSPGEEWFVRLFALAGLLYSAYWIWWRWTETLNPDALWFSVPLVLAETYGVVATAFLVFTALRLKRREPLPAPENTSVDVFVTIYDEPLEIVRRTALGARAIRYPHRSYLLDDGDREEVKRLAAELGIGYIRRDGNEHAKAGNLNNALRVTDGEFILQLDADHVPLPHILDRLLGFMRDPDVAFVQSPQDFYNTAAFTYDVDERARRIWEEQRIFFSIIQPGKDRWNAAFFCGSCAVIRRSALEEIGGFATETITEDLETSLLLQARGWKSAFYGESLAFGLAPASAGAYHVQRLRWGQGAMQILRRMNPLTLPGLSIPQRICYFASLFHYYEGLYRLVLYLSPIVFFLSGVLPIRTTDGAFLARFVPYLAVHLAMFELLMRGKGYALLAERFSMVKFFTYVRAVSGYFTRKRLKFEVTPKGATDVPFWTFAPQLALMVLVVVSLIWAIYAYRFGWIDYDVPGWGSLAFWLNLAWSAYIFGFAGYVVHLSLYYNQQRSDERFVDHIPVEARVHDAAGGLGEPEVVLTEDLNPRGAAFRAPAALEKGTRVRITLPLVTGEVTAEGEVTNVRAGPNQRGRSYIHGVEFHDLSVNDRDRIELHCIHHAVSIRRLRYREAFDVFGSMFRLLYDERSGRRERVRFPVSIHVEPDGEGEPWREAGVGLLDEVSAGGARLIVVGQLFAPGTRLEYRINGLDEAPMRGEVVYTRAFQTPAGVCFAMGLRRDAPPRRVASDPAAAASEPELA